MPEIQTSNLDDLDALLDRNLDDIADLPEFKTFHPGVHKCTVTWKSKLINKTVDGVKKDVPHLELNLVLIETLEHADAKSDADPCKAGDRCSTAYDLTNENAMGALKKATASLGAHLGTTNVRDIVRGSDGFEVAAVTTVRKDKDFKDNGRAYLQVQDLMVL